MPDPDRSDALRLIEANIKDYGFHVYLIAQSSAPRFAYTIGLRDSIGAELVLAGAIYYMAEEVLQILHSLREQLEVSVEVDRRAGRDVATSFARTYDVKGLGTFTLQRAHMSWTSELLLGAFDYYGSSRVDTYQIVPDAGHHTVDVPDMTKEWSAAGDLVWRWLREPWPYAFPEAATATTNLAALRGERVTEVARWEADDWEMYAGDGSNVPQDEMRVVPVTCLVSVDPSLAPALELAIGDGIWRDADAGDWNVWD